MAIYVYGLMRSSDARRAVPGDSNGTPPVELVEDRGVSALVTETPEGALRVRRESILAHSDVLQAAFQHGPVLPLRFGTALVDREAVTRELISPDAERLTARLGALEDKAEMQLKARYLEEPLLRSILGQDRSLAQAAARNRELPPAATHFERIRIGEAIAVAVQARRAEDEQAMVEMLRPLVVEVSYSEPQHERTALNAAFLLKHKDLKRFDQAVERLSEARASDVEFKLIGPLPPYSFADQQWELVSPAPENEGRTTSWA